MKTSAQYEPIDIDKFRRPPEVVMRLAHGQLSSNSLIFHAHPAAPPEKKLFKRNVWEIDQQDFGRAIYTVASADADAVAEFHECLKQVCVNIYRMSC